MDFTDLLAYQKAYKLAMDIFEISKSFPKEETYSLSGQGRRSSRSVCAQIAERYRKRRYPAYFISKLTDADGENAEIQVWMNFAHSCRYIEKNVYDDLLAQSYEVRRLIGHMIYNPQQFGANPSP
ncbi:MAG: four helix bundle protein [Haliscomenobacteraceae bacterium CHB4]|nr:four helix bundle protein [Haliscomenobacteraceae bacterium CHB4]